MNDTKPKIKLFLTDLDGVLTDGSIYYSGTGELSKRFYVHDGMGLEIIRELGIKTGLVTTDNSRIVEHRAKDLHFTYVLKDVAKGTKLSAAKELCDKVGISLSEASYIGDDVNCWDLLASVGYPICPSDAQDIIRKIPGIFVTKLPGGRGAVREVINHFLAEKMFDTDTSMDQLVESHFRI